MMLCTRHSSSEAADLTEDLTDAGYTMEDFHLKKKKNSRCSKSLRTYFALS